MGRIPSVESKSVSLYGLSYIRPYHREIARRLVLGERAAGICEDLGMTEGRMSIIVNSPLFKMEVKRLEEERDKGVADVTQTLRHLSPIALEVIERTMHNPECGKRLRFDAAESILDRAGYGKTAKINVGGGVVHSHANLTEAELRKLVSERVERMKQEVLEREKQEEEAKGIDIEFENVGECSNSERPFEEVKNEVYPLE